MNNHISKLEYLPNELIIHVFDYIDARYIFEAFYDLNDRYNKLLKTLKNLRLTLLKGVDQEFDSFDHFSSYIDTLIIEDEIFINLIDLNNVRHVILYCASDTILAQINTNNFPYLEYFSISNNMLVNSNLYKKLFADTFNDLKYCNLCASVSRQAKTRFCSLKMGGIDLDVYQSILSACPNLYYLKLRILRSDIRPMIVRSHRNLKQLLIDVEISGWPYNDQLIDRFLEYVPNVKQVNVYTSNFISKIKESIVEYDWLATIIANRLLLLWKFNFLFHLNWSSKSNELQDRNIIHQLETNFINVHNNRYQSRLMIKLL